MMPREMLPGCHAVGIRELKLSGRTEPLMARTDMLTIIRVI